MRRALRIFPLRRPALLLLAVSGGLLGSATAWAQELEPRAYSSSPVGSNFALAGYSWSGGSVLVDASLPISNIESQIDSLFAGYSRTFGVGGRAASVAVIVPWFRGTISGDVFEDRRTVERVGFGDLRFRLAYNLLGGRPCRRPSSRGRRSARRSGSA